MTAISAEQPLAEKAGLAPLRAGTKLYDFLFGLPLIAWYGLGLYVQAPVLLSEIAAIASTPYSPQR